MRAWQILTEATQKGREYNHLEDLVTFAGSKGALKAAEILTRLGQDSKDVSIKWDGNPTLFWGREPNGEFVMTGKPEDSASFKVWLDPPSNKGRIRILALL